MPFPSDAMRAWCRSIEDLRQAMCKLGKAGEDGWCQCDIGDAIRFCPQDQQAQLCSGLFWSIWINQVLFTVLPRELYDQFCGIYTFPKLHSHPTAGHASPAFLISPPAAADERCQYPRPTMELLMHDKKEFWGEVAAWLRQNGQVNRCEAAEAKFKADLGRRFPEEFHFLW
jgi:hypothetical protein